MFPLDDDGLFLEFDEESEKIKRMIVKGTGKIQMKDTTVNEAVIHFAELDLRQYAVIVDAIDDMFRHTCVQRKNKENITETTYIDGEYKDALTIISMFLQQFETSDPFYGTMTRFSIEDEIISKFDPLENEDKTVALLLAIFSRVLVLQCFINEVLGDMADGTPLDFENKYILMSRLEIPFRIHHYKGDFLFGFHLRSIEDYYHFLLMTFISNQPNIARCQCCGRFFIPKTNKKTLYCDRKIKGDKTCKDVAPALKHKLEADEVIQAFDRANQKMYKRYERQLNSDHTLPKGMKYSDYYEWREKAAKLRNDYLLGELSKEEA